jgi:hypothetical protein
MSWRKHELEIALKYPNVAYYRLPIDNLHPIRQGDAPRYTFPFFDAQSIHHTWKFHLNTGTPPASDGKSVGGHRFPDAERSPALRCPKDVGCMGVWDLLNRFFFIHIAEVRDCADMQMGCNVDRRSAICTLYKAGW